MSHPNKSSDSGSNSIEKIYIEIVKLYITVITSLLCVNVRQANFLNAAKFVFPYSHLCQYIFGRNVQLMTCLKLMFNLKVGKIDIWPNLKDERAEWI